MTVITRYCLVTGLCLLISGCGLLSGTDSSTPKDPQELADQAAVDPNLADVEGAAEDITAENTQAVSEAGAAENLSPPEDTGSSQVTESFVDLLWQVPTKAVEKYHLEYGFAEGTLDQHIEVPVAQLEKIDHPEFGPLFRYRLKPVPPDKTLFYTIQAENQFGKSEKSPVQSVSIQ